MPQILAPSSATNPCTAPATTRALGVSLFDTRPRLSPAPPNSTDNSLWQVRRRPILIHTAAMPELQQRGSLISSGAAPAAHSSSVDHDQREGDPHQPSPFPPWVHGFDHTSADDAHLLAAPPTARPNTRHYRPPPAHYKPGRKWDHMRSPSPPLMSTPISDSQTRWQPFMYSGPTPHEQEARARVVDQAWLDEHMPALSQGWREEDDVRADGEQMQVWSGKGLMYKGRWLISPERQERSVRLFWVSLALYLLRLDVGYTKVRERKPADLCPWIS